MDTVLNWLWQGCAVALVTGALLRLLHGVPAHGRYVACWASLLAVFALAVVPLVGGAPASLPPVPGGASPGAIVSVPDAWWTSTAAIAAAWTLWSAVCGARFALAVVSLRRTRKASRPFPRDVESRLPCWTEVKRRGRSTRLVVSDRVRAAAVLGCGTPVIAIAPRLFQHLTDDEIDRIVIHEWAHVQRRDDWANLVQLALRAAAGWHPAVWWLDRRLQAEREDACDEMTVRVTDSANRYAASLVKLASLPPVGRTTLAALGILSSTGIAGRVRRILSQRTPAWHVWSTSATACAVSLLAILALGVGGISLVAVKDATGIAERHPAIAVPPDEQRSSGGPTSTSPVTVSNGSEDAGPRTRYTPRRDRPLAPTANRPPDAATDGSGSPVSGTFAIDPVDTSPSAVAHDTGTETADALHTPTVVEIESSTPPSVEHPANPQPSSPWAAAADAGVALGRTSINAGLATAGLFSRVGKRVAGSFRGTRLASASRQSE